MQKSIICTCAVIIFCQKFISTVVSADLHHIIKGSVYGTVWTLALCSLKALNQLLKYNAYIWTDERVLQKQKADQTPAVIKIQQASQQEIPACVKLYIVLLLNKGNREIIFTAMKINLKFQTTEKNYFYFTRILVIYIV